MAHTSRRALPYEMQRAFLLIDGRQIGAIKINRLGGATETASHLLPGGSLGPTRAGLSPLHQLWLAPSQIRANISHDLPIGCATDF
jgi:hypothetical protein